MYEALKKRKKDKKCKARTKIIIVDITERVCREGVKGEECTFQDELPIKRPSESFINKPS
jgi:hypothetical protein